MDTQDLMPGARRVSWEGFSIIVPNLRAVVRLAIDLRLEVFTIEEWNDPWIGWECRHTAIQTAPYEFDVLEAYEPN